MAGTTRELDFGVITVASVVFVLLLVVIVAGSEAWFRYEVRLRESKLLAEYGENRDLLALKAEQAKQLSGEAQGTLAIDEAMKAVAERH